MLPDIQPGNTKILYFFNCLLDGMHTNLPSGVRLFRLPRQLGKSGVNLTVLWRFRHRTLLLPHSYMVSATRSRFPNCRIQRSCQPMKLNCRQNSLHLFPAIIFSETFIASLAVISEFSARMNPDIL